MGARTRRLIDDIYQRGRLRAVRSPPPTSRAHKGSGGWWGWSDEKHAFEWLFWAGRITTALAPRLRTALRSAGTRAAAGHSRSARACSRADAHRELLRISARALGVATAGDLRDYFRLSPADMKGRIEELVEAGELFAGARRGLGQAGLPPHRTRAFRARSRPARCSRRSIRWSSSGRAPSACSTSATASRSTRRPKSASIGYYVLPFLLGDRIVARVDLKADRPAGVLRVLCRLCRARRAARNRRRTAARN